MEYFDKIVCVTYEELLIVIPKDTLSSLLYRGKTQRVDRGGGFDGYAQHNYFSLPEHYRIHFEQKYGNPVELIREQCIKSRLKVNDAARTFSRDYRYDKAGERVSLTERKEEEYTINTSVLNELIPILNDRGGYRKALGGSARKVWEMIIGTSDRLRDSYNHTLPENVARLKDKINQYKKEGYFYLVSKKIGNDDTLRITEETGDQIIALKRNNIPVYTDSQILVESNRIANEKGWKQLRSIQSLHQFLDHPDIEPSQYDVIHDELKAHQRCSHKSRTELPSTRNSLWYGDGAKINLYYKDYDKDGELVVRTTQVHEVTDAYSEVFLGYHIPDSKDYEVRYNAYRMVIRVPGRKPYGPIYDNQGDHKKL